MNQDHVVWAGAICVENEFGNGGAYFIRERIEALMDDDDIKGVEMWERIGAAYDRLGGASALFH